MKAAGGVPAWPLRSWVAGLLMAGVVGAGCARTVEVVGREVVTDGRQESAPARSAGNLPTSFIVVTPASVSTDCPPVLRDPGINAVLTLRHSTLQPTREADGTVHYWAIGDYTAEPRGRYGEEPGEGLRIDCSRLRALGIVRVETG
ncbi:MAG TPA: hypothetical protein VK936_12800 [Longimicrobiales bacterium]|nr:hypothetical protein [Longimicrobiales bacterium]